MEGLLKIAADAALTGLRWGATAAVGSIAAGVTYQLVRQTMANREAAAKEAAAE